MGVVIRRLVWLECIGVISGCCYKEVSSYYLCLLHLYILTFFGSSIHTSLFISKMCFHSCLCYFCAI